MKVKSIDFDPILKPYLLSANGFTEKNLENNTI